jgi:hypothetical protein
MECMCGTTSSRCTRKACAAAGFDAGQHMQMKCDTCRYGLAQRAAPPSKGL